MNRYRVTAPVVLIVFNRPECTRRVFSRIAEAQPSRLFIIADGPRAGVGSDARKCREVREIVQHIDWDCEVSADFSETNLGCRRRIAGGLDWVFSQIESAIILEDDCLPGAGFFRFCDELLEKYRDEPRVMMICGTNLLRESPTDSGYLFTTHGRVWGWATWKRAWDTYDVDLESWPRKKLENPFRELPFHDKEIKQLEKTLDNLADANPDNWDHDAWDFQWDYNRYIHNGLAITPKVNLVSNIGFGHDATHTRNQDDAIFDTFANIPVGQLGFPLTHPAAVECSLDYERAFCERIIRKHPKERLRKFFKRAARFFKKAQ